MSINHLVGLTIEPKLDIFCHDITTTGEADIQGDLKVGGVAQIETLDANSAEIKNDLLVGGDISCNQLGCLLVNTNEIKNPNSRIVTTGVSPYLSLGTEIIPAGYVTSITSTAYFDDTYTRWDPTSASYKNVLRVKALFSAAVPIPPASAQASFEIDINNVNSIFHNGIPVYFRGSLRSSVASQRGSLFGVGLVQTDLLGKIKVFFVTADHSDVSSSNTSCEFEIEILEA